MTVLMNALMQERARIASAIHQGPLQEITTTLVQLEILEELLERDPARGRELVGEIKASAQSALNDLRAAIFDLTPVVPDSAWLHEGLKRLVDNLARDWGLELSFEASGQATSIKAEAIGLVFTFVQEGVTNLRKYSPSKRGQVRLWFEGETLHASVLDEGTAPRGNVLERSGHGLNLLWGRARLLGGDVRIEQTLDRGTRVVLEIPT